MGQSTYERERDRRGFKELAKLAGSPPRPKAASVSGIRRATEPDENDSGMVDLQALASSDPGAVDRASVTPLASATLFEDEPVAKALPSSPASRPSGQLVSPFSPAAASVHPAAQAAPVVSPSVSRPIVASAQATLRSGSPTPSRRSAYGRISAFVGLAAIAAGAFFVVRTVRGPLAETTPSAPGVVTASHAAAEPPSVVAQAPTPAADPGVDPLSLPKDTAGAPGHHAARPWRTTRGTQTLVAKADPKEADETAPAAKAEAPAVKAAPLPPPPAANNALLSLMAAAATTPATPTSAPAAAAPAATEAAPIPAAATVAGNGLSPRPSQGQATGALGGVLPEARACLNDEDGVSRAHVVFGSNGAVQSVAVSGFAAGKPVEACIKAALGKAHVAPFAEASYGATVTVRP